ncbi:hypothetical protein, partial [Mesorhizobium sp. M5C.F.Ca.ET.164.01.1.1]
MTADDFRDAQDSEEWARSDEDATAHVDADAKTPAIERPRLLAPPLKLDGFVPSAFSTGEETRAPDTSILGKLPVPLI